MIGNRLVLIAVGENSSVGVGMVVGVTMAVWVLTGTGRPVRTGEDRGEISVPAAVVAGVTVIVFWSGAVKVGVNSEVERSP
jgi:hypothetical protein